MGASNFLESYFGDIISFRQTEAFEMCAILPTLRIIFFSVYLLSSSNAEALVAAAREIGLEVSADKTKYMAMSRNQNTIRITI